VHWRNTGSQKILNSILHSNFVALTAAFVSRDIITSNTWNQLSKPRTPHTTSSICLLLTISCHRRQVTIHISCYPTAGCIMWLVKREQINFRPATDRSAVPDLTYRKSGCHWPVSGQVRLQSPASHDIMRLVTYAHQQLFIMARNGSV
jgi:hypothetical protein